MRASMAAHVCSGRGHHQATRTPKPEDARVTVQAPGFVLSAHGAARGPDEQSDAGGVTGLGVVVDPGDVGGRRHVSGIPDQSVMAQVDRFEPGPPRFLDAIAGREAPREIGNRDAARVVIMPTTCRVSALSSPLAHAR